MSLQGGGLLHDALPLASAGLRSLADKHRILLIADEVGPDAGGWLW
jgi:acetylornithine/succinyldiaminopimelate/putrescine aminotransferase